MENKFRLLVEYNTHIMCSSINFIADIFIGSYKWKVDWELSNWKANSNQASQRADTEH